MSVLGYPFSAPPLPVILREAVFPEKSPSLRSRQAQEVVILAKAGIHGFHARYEGRTGFPPSRE
jgi:hypothetical protein